PSRRGRSASPGCGDTRRSAGSHHLVNDTCVMKVHTDERRGRAPDLPQELQVRPVAVQLHEEGLLLVELPHLAVLVELAQAGAPLRPARPRLLVQQERELITAPAA